MADAIATAYVEVGLRDTGLRRGMAETRREVTGFQQALAQTVPGVNTLARAMQFGLAGAAVYAGARFGEMVFSMAEAGAGVLRLQQGFDALWGSLETNSAAALGALREAAGGTINDANLMLAANRAALLGVSTSAEDLSTLLELARLRARRLGIDTTQAFDNIVTGIGRASPLILDNLGLIIDQEAANAAYARSLGKTASALTEAEKKQALLNEVLRIGKQELKETDGVTNDAADAFDRLTVARQNYQAQVSADVAERTAPVAESAATLFEVMTRNTEIALAMASRSWDEYVARSKARADEAVRILGTAGQELIEQFRPKVSFEEWERLKQAENDAALELANFNRLMGQIDSSALRGAALDAEGLADALNELNAATTLTIVGLGTELGGEASYVMDQIATAIAQGNITLEEGTVLLNEYLVAYQNLIGFIAGNATELTPEGLLAVRAGEQVERERVTNMLGLNKTGINEAQRAAEQAARELRSTIEGVIRPTFAGDPTGLLDAMGLHIDTADEDARRLASVMAEGLSSEWTQYFAGKGLLKPEDLADDDTARAAAARILRLFQMGQFPQLIDKETAKQRVKELLLGQANTEQLVNEIMQELGAEGVKASRQQVETALGAVPATAETSVSVAVAPVTVQASVVLNQLTNEAVHNWLATAQGLFNVDTARLNAAVILGDLPSTEISRWRSAATGIMFNATPRLLPPTTDEKQGFRNEAIGILFDATPRLARLSPTAGDTWATENQALMEAAIVDATVALAPLNVNDVNRWVEKNTGFAEGLILDATVTLPDASARAKEWMDAFIGGVRDYPPLDLMESLEGAQGTGGTSAFTQALATNLNADIAVNKAALLVPIGTDIGTSLRSAILTALVGGGDFGALARLQVAFASDLGANADALDTTVDLLSGHLRSQFLEGLGGTELGAVNALSLALNDDLIRNGDAILGADGRSIGSIFGQYITDGFGDGVAYVSPLAKAIQDDWDKKQGQLDPILDKMGDYIGERLSARIGKNVSIVQTVINAAVTEMAEELADIAQQGGQ